MSKYTIYASTDDNCDERMCLRYQIGDNALHPFSGNMIQLPIARTQPGPGHEWIGVKVRHDPGVGWMLIVTSPGDDTELTPKKNMAELQAMTKQELIQLVVERAAELQSLEVKHRLLEHDQADAVNNAFLGLLKRLCIEPDRARLTEDDMHRLITSGLLGWEYHDAAEACVAAAERVMAAFDPRLIGSDLGEDPTDDCDHTYEFYGKRYDGSAVWQCSKCGVEE